MMQCFSHCLFAYLITRRTVLVEEMGKKSKSHLGEVLSERGSRWPFLQYTPYI